MESPHKPQKPTCVCVVCVCVCDLLIKLYLRLAEQNTTITIQKYVNK